MVIQSKLFSLKMLHPEITWWHSADILKKSSYSLLKESLTPLIEIDSIRINFSTESLWLMNICLGFLMFGVALDMKIADFRRVIEFPKSVLVGLISQLLLLPILTLILILLWNPHPSVALGLIMVAACPGGNISNFATHLGRGNAALSVTMTSIVTLGAILITPLNFLVMARFIPSVASRMAEIHVGPVEMFEIILKLILIPLILGMMLNAHLPALTNKIKKAVRTGSILIFAAFIVFALADNYSIIINYLHIVFIIVVLHNLLAFGLGFYFARINKLPLRDCKAICMETGIQNSGLGLVLIFNFFSTLGGMVLVAAFWGIWDLVSSFLLSMYWNRRDKKIDKREGTGPLAKSI